MGLLLRLAFISVAAMLQVRSSEPLYGSAPHICYLLARSPVASSRAKAARSAVFRYRNLNAGELPLQRALSRRSIYRMQSNIYFQHFPGGGGHRPWSENYYDSFPAPALFTFLSRLRIPPSRYSPLVHNVYSQVAFVSSLNTTVPQPVALFTSYDAATDTTTLASCLPTNSSLALAPGTPVKYTLESTVQGEEKVPL
jgi:hypothetical protein